MPRSSARSRNYREEASDDDDDEIEQTQQTQKRPRLSVPGRSQASGSSSQRKGKGRASQSQTVVLGDSDEEEEEDEDDQDNVPAKPLTKDEIKQQTGSTPLNPGVAKPKLNMHITEYESALGKITNVLEYLSDSALTVEELFEEGENNLISELDQSVREVIDSRYEMEIRRTILQKMVGSLDAGREVISPDQIFRETYRKGLERHQTMTSRQKYMESDDYHKFRSIIWEVHNTGAPMPPLTEQIPAEPGDEADEVEDFEQGGVVQNFKCPLTTGTLEDPVSSALCPHSYSKSAIEEYLAGKAREHRPATCPQAGCNAVLSPAVLKPDANLAKRVAAFLRRQQTQGTQAAGGSGTQAGAGGAGGARKGAAKVEGQEDAIEEAEEGSDDEEEIELD